MKRLLISGVILCLIVFLCVWSSVYTNRITNELIEDVKALQQNPTRQGVEALQSKWEKNDPMLYCISEHNDVTEIDKTIDMIAASFEFDEPEHFKMSCTEALHALEHIQKSEAALWCYVI
ncbi:MAG: DUF4363 family protein [Oscillospiraceae bacterium]|jgi:hypothetical protein|nr:DUF4363 family protein [Oscillospiraceae bacterium]